MIRNTAGMAMPDAELAEALLSMKGALNKVGNNVTQTAKRMNDDKNQGQPLPFAEEDPMEMRHSRDLFWVLQTRPTLWPGP